MVRLMADEPGPIAGANPDLLDTPQAGRAAVRGGAMRAVGYAGGVLLGVAGGALLLRALGVADTGRYITVIALTTIVAGISDFGLTALAVRELALRTGAERARLARGVLGLRLVLSVSGVAVALAFTLLAGYPGRMVQGTAIAGTGVILQSAQITLSASLMSRLRLGWVTAIELVRQALTLAMIGVGVALGTGLLAFLSIPVLAGIVIVGITGALVHGDVPLRPSFRRADWAAVGREVLPYSAATAAHVVYFRIAVVIVSLVASSRETGLFSASFRVIETLIVMPNLVVGAAFPIFARAARDDRVRLAYSVQRMFETCVLLGVLSALLLALTPHTIIRIIGGADFADAAPVLRVQSIALATGFLNSLWGYAMLSLSQYRRALLVNSAALLAGGVLAALLASRNGALGAGWATAIAELVLVVAAPLAMRRGHEDLSPSLGVLPKAALAGGVAACITLVPGVPEIADAAIAGVVFLAISFALRAVPDEIVHELRSVRARGG